MFAVPMAVSRPAAAEPVEEILRREKVGRLCRATPAVATPETSLADTLRLLKGDCGGCVVIVEDDSGPAPGSRPVGIFTERDYLDKIALATPAPDTARLSIESFMTEAPTVLTEDATLESAIQLMTRGGYRHLPLVDRGGRLLGLLSARDIIQFLAELFPTEIMNLPPAAAEGALSRDGG